MYIYIYICMKMHLPRKSKKLPTMPFSSVGSSPGIDDLHLKLPKGARMKPQRVWDVPGWKGLWMDQWLLNRLLTRIMNHLFSRKSESRAKPIFVTYKWHILGLFHPLILTFDKSTSRDIQVGLPPLFTGRGPDHRPVKLN